MAREITASDVEAAEADLVAAKKGKDRGKRQAAAERLAELRSAFRAQEEVAGRRAGMVATSSEG